MPQKSHMILAMTILVGLFLITTALDNYGYLLFFLNQSNTLGYI